MRFSGTGTLAHLGGRVPSAPFQAFSPSSASASCTSSLAPARLRYLRAHALARATASFSQLDFRAEVSLCADTPRAQCAGIVATCHQLQRAPRDLQRRPAHAGAGAQQALHTEAYLFESNPPLFGLHALNVYLFKSNASFIGGLDGLSVIAVASALSPRSG